jgi:TolA-binding protein
MKKMHSAWMFFILMQCVVPACAYESGDVAESIREIYGQLEKLRKKVADQQAQINVLQEQNKAQQEELQRSRDEQSTKAAMDVVLKKTPEEIIQIAVDKMSSGDTDGALNLLNVFIKNNPKSIYLGKMEHYVGNAYFQEQKYQEAAAAYLSSYEHNSSGSKAAWSLHKLAQCLKKLSDLTDSEEKRSKLRENCRATVDKLINNHPNYEMIAEVRREFGDR